MRGTHQTVHSKGTDVNNNPLHKDNPTLTHVIERNIRPITAFSGNMIFVYVHLG